VENNIRRIKQRSMKTKLYKILGVALTLVLLASLTVGLVTVPAGAATSNLKFTKLELPQVEEWTNAADFANPTEGDFWATPGISLGPIAQSPDSGVLFAAVAPGYYPGASWFHVLKSVDGGKTWVTTDFNNVSPGADPIVDMVASPIYDDDSTIVVATMTSVYISDDAGKTFVLAATGFGGPITDLDVALDEDEDLTLMVSTLGGDVWVQKGLLPFKAQQVGASALACAFLPTFGIDGDIGICAVVTTGATTTMRFSFGDTSNPVPADWGAGIADAPFKDAEGIDFGSSYARIAFPDDFDAFGVGNNVCFVGIATHLDAYQWYSDISLPPTDGSDVYRVTCKEAGTSSAKDLDVRGVETTLLPTATPITSIDVCGDAEAATILVGTDNLNLMDTPTAWFVYISEDSGDSWAPATKQPTGGTRWHWTGGAWAFPTAADNLAFLHGMTRVMMADDFCNGGTAYASTMGMFTDAFQRSSDGGDSWNQISIIDYGLNGGYAYAVTDKGLAAAGFSTAGTARMMTQFDNGFAYHGALWETTNSGKNWERIFSYANAGVTDTLRQIKMLGDGSAWFAVDYANAVMWRTTDEGVFWKKINLKAGMNAFEPASATSFYVGIASGDHNIYWTTRSGVGWEEPEDNDAAGLPIVNFTLRGDKVVIGTADGKVFVSDDGGVTVMKCGVNNPGEAGTITIATADLGFDANNIIYAAMPAQFTGPPPPTPLQGVGIWRTEVNWDDPADSQWVRIDDFQDSTNSIGDTDDYYSAALFTAGGPAIALPPSGILYAVDATLVNTDSITSPSVYAGGLWRSTNPTADIDSIVPPYFERENKGLTGDGLAGSDAIGLLDLDLKPPTLAPTFFCANGAAPYYEQIVMFTDTLNVGVPLVTPEADATGVGLLPENMVGDVYPVVAFAWEEMAGATGYQYQVSIDPDFKTKVLSAFTDDLGTIIDNWLLSNTTYYWRVRVADAGSLIGAPLISPWSETYKFKTAIGPTMQRPLLQAPLAGELDVPLSPTFEWSGIEWAEVYEYELALDPTTTAGGYFTEPLVALVGANSLVSTAWKCDIALDYSTRYYWHVKAIGVDTDTPWSDVGTFTTMGVPPAPPTTQPPVVIPPAENITPAWIWAIVIIGAILVIAVIVLIVTTRRVP